MADDFNTLLEEFSTVAAFIDAKEDELAGIKKVRDKIKAALMAKMNEMKLTTGRSQAGHCVSIVSSSSAKVVDGDAFFAFVIETGNSDMLTRRASVEAIDEYLAVTNKLPPGIEYVKANTLRFTRAK